MSTNQKPVLFRHHPVTHQKMLFLTARDCLQGCDRRQVHHLKNPQNR